MLWLFKYNCMLFLISTMTFMLHSISGDLSAKLRQINLYTGSGHVYRCSSKCSNNESSREWKKDRERRHIVLSQIPKEILSNKIVYFDWKVQTVTTQGHTVERRFKVFKGGMSNFMTQFWQVTQCKATQEKTANPLGRD